MNFKCDNCGDIDRILFDGYLFGDVQLEGVIFYASYEGGEIVVGFNDEEDEKYCKNHMNIKTILEDALWFVKKLDVAQCPKCGEDVEGPDCW